jgi:RNA polymerase sigma-70 factor (ECF subfamily)
LTCPFRELQNRKIAMGTSAVTVLPAPAGIEDFLSVRPRLFRIAYRMLGRVPDAEDVVQDVWVRWQRTDRARVNDRVAFLVKTTTNAALNVAGSARFRREVTVGSEVLDWHPAQEDPASAAERLDDVENAVRLLVQRDRRNSLDNPRQRAPTGAEGPCPTR